MMIAFVATGGTSSAAPADAGVAPGQGLAIAQTERLDPRAGGLSIGFTFGISIAGHQNQVAQASSNAIDMGVIGTTLSSPGCDGSKPTMPADQQPQPLQVDSRDPSAAQGKDEDEKALPVPIHKHAMANTTPFGEAITTTAAYGVPGVLQVGQGVSHSTSGLVDNGATRQATATTDIADINLGNVVVLNGLHWEALWSSAGDAPSIGTFTIGSATIAGKPIPTNDPMQAITQINQFLTTSQLGIQLAPPTIRQTGGVEFVDPLGIEVVPSHTRDTAASAALGGLQPVRQGAFDALLNADCSFSTPITIEDIVVGSVTGAGSFGITLGGVQAMSADIAANPFHLGTFALGSAPSLGGAAGANGVSLGGTAAKPGAPAGGAAAGAPAASQAPAAPKTSPVAAIAA
ncbi:MAG TPA: hypothetical protein VGJ03_05225, partial [Acidimicrobiales bacterium]